MDALPHHRAAYRQALERVFGVRGEITEIEFWGKLAPQIIEELARLHGVPRGEIARRMPEAIRELESSFLASLHKGQIRVLPGVRGLLRALKRQGHKLGVVTGNPQPITQALLSRGGLERYFDLVVCGSKAKSRIELVGEAIAQAEREFGRRFRGKQIVVVGDSPRDIEGGRPWGALTVAVATGFSSREKLTKHKPDHLFGSLADQGVFEVLAGKSKYFGGAKVNRRALVV